MTENPSLFCPVSMKLQSEAKKKNLLVLEGCRGCRVLLKTTALRYFLCKSNLPTVSDRNHKCPMTISKYFVFSIKLPSWASVQTVKVSLRKDSPCTVSIRYILGCIFGLAVCSLPPHVVNSDKIVVIFLKPSVFFWIQYWTIS